MKKKIHASSSNKKLSKKLWSIQILHDDVQFYPSSELGIDFYNSIDGWRAMETLIGHRVTRPHIKRDKRDFITLHYSIREKLF